MKAHVFLVTMAIGLLHVLQIFSDELCMYMQNMYSPNVSIDFFCKINPHTKIVLFMSENLHKICIYYLSVCSVPPFSILDKDKSPGQNQQNGIYPSC